MNHLTGLELNLIERAGYLVRRGAIDPSSLSVALPSPILAVCEDVLGAGLIPRPREVRPARWERSGGAALDASVSELALGQRSVWVAAAGESDAVVSVIPGSHLTPLDASDLEVLRGNPPDEMPDQVCVRLQPGDAALFSGTLLRQWVESAGLQAVRCWEVRKERSSVAGPSGI